MVVCEDPWWMLGRVLEYFLWLLPSWKGNRRIESEGPPARLCFIRGVIYWLRGGAAWISHPRTPAASKIRSACFPSRIPETTRRRGTRLSLDIRDSSSKIGPTVMLARMVFSSHPSRETASTPTPSTRRSTSLEAAFALAASTESGSLSKAYTGANPRMAAATESIPDPSQHPPRVLAHHHPASTLILREWLDEGRCRTPIPESAQYPTVHPPQPRRLRADLPMAA